MFPDKELGFKTFDRELGMNDQPEDRVKHYNEFYHSLSEEWENAGHTLSD